MSVKIGVYVRKLSHAPVLAHIEESIPEKSLGCSKHCKSVSRGSSVIRKYQVRIKVMKMVRSERLHQLRLIECKRETYHSVSGLIQYQSIGEKMVTSVSNYSYLVPVFSV